jgi:hypothetical protein
MILFGVHLILAIMTMWLVTRKSGELDWFDWSMYLVCTLSLAASWMLATLSIIKVWTELWK